MISTLQPVVERTHSRKALELRASRRALVPTTRTRSQPSFCTARWKRRRTLTVFAMASGERMPERNTDSPRRTTSRSSWISRSLPRVSREIFRRTEFDPMSTAAKVGINERTTVYQRERAGMENRGGTLEATQAVAVLTWALAADFAALRAGEENSLRARVRTSTAWRNLLRVIA